jgi:hypothetical protein
MVIALSTDNTERRRALEWLMSERIAHLKLFQAVQIDDDGAANRFKVWLSESDIDDRQFG